MTQDFLSLMMIVGLFQVIFDSIHPADDTLDLVSYVGLYYADLGVEEL